MIGFLYHNDLIRKLDVSAFNKLSSEQSIRGRITPLHVVLACSTFKATHDPSLYGALAAAKEKHATVGCDAYQDDTSVYPWWALPSSKARKENSYLLVHGIPTPDSDRRSLRNAQRDTFLRYKGAATRRNGFRGRILFLYVLAAHHSTTESLQVTDYRDATVVSGGDESLRPVTPPTGLYTTSFAVEESLKYLDVLWLPHFRDARPTTAKKVGQEGDWGIETEVGMTHKLITYMLYASYQFPDVPFISKGDDDAFYKIPQIVIELESMQAEMNSFNNQSKRYRVKYAEWGALKRNGDGYQLFTQGFFFLVSGSLLKLFTAELPPLVRRAKTPFLIKHRNDMSPEDIMILSITLILLPFDLKYKYLYHANLAHFEDRFFALLVDAARRFLFDSSCTIGKDHCDLVYNRVESPCRAHYMWKAPPKNVVHRRNSLAIHRTLSLRLYERVLLYMSNPAGLFNHSDSATAKFIQELRWDEDDVYDHINFTALEQSPLWEELFPFRRDAPLDDDARWWDDTHTTRLPFVSGVSVYPFISKNSSEKQFLFPPSSDGVDYRFASGLLLNNITCVP
ncbi:hypothetical protein, conserved [Angomonas deanei]|uniref:Galactosyltransferase n=1 Tax=Angomonas deanei TaxID=59799 RepID=A0A7G2CLH0_9TRYP|nr:hypothetical protein, conserved [Angomonas deanei]